MAQSTRSIALDLAALRLPAPSPAMAFAIRSGVVVAAAIWLGKMPGIVEHNSTWIMISALTVLQPTVGNAMLRGLLRIAGTVAGALTAILLFGLFAQSPPLMMAAFFVVQAIGAYGNTGPRFQYAWFVWAFTTAIVLGSAVVGEDAVETLAFERASMVVLGILLVLVADLLLWPSRAEPKLRASLAARARSLGAGLAAAVVPESRDGVDEPATNEADPSAITGELALVEAARSELGVSREHADALTRVALVLETLSSRARELIRGAGALSVLDEDRSLRAAALALADQIEQALERAAQALAEDRPLRPARETLDEALRALEREHDRGAAERSVTEGFAASLAALRDLVTGVHALEDALADDTRAAHARPGPGIARLRLDPFRTKVALRTGIAVTSVIVLVMALGWPMNAVVAPIAFLIAPLTRGAARQTLLAMLLMIGAGWIVADLILVHVTPELQRMPGVLLVPFALAATLGWVAATRPPLAMAPLLVGLVALLPVFGGLGAAADVYGSYNTVCYMTLALFTGAAFSQTMWPATSAGLFRARVAALLERCADAVSQAPGLEDTARHDAAVELIGAGAQHLAQLAKLDAQARHERVEQGLDDASRGALIVAMTRFVDAAASFRPLRSEVAEHAPLAPLEDAMAREDAALRESMARVAERLRGGDGEGRSTLVEARRATREAIDGLRARAEAAPGLEPAERRRWLIVLDSRRRLVERQLDLEQWLETTRSAERDV